MGFPVPKSAELLKEKDEFEAYKWSPASEENGIPLRYRIVINLNGWKKKEQEGSLTVYEKNNQEVDVISQTDYLSIGLSQTPKK
ncbi:hypothetical protein [Neobacillus sp. OS1-33]|jgi:hypothetical protein|uniref:hypothetical protein n=1 Tax=Neobacillus sp. OS1-33 TaxID=3070683 RepID=UPI0027DFE09D|nr:hypothetical protein [Neobacillus sp. OS1-33]WML27330.1 hypothetical protein RCG22_06835 [Neobacillus sp. OS1-33]